MFYECLFRNLQFYYVFLTLENKNAGKKHGCITSGKPGRQSATIQVGDQMATLLTTTRTLHWTLKGSTVREKHEFISQASILKYEP